MKNSSNIVLLLGIALSVSTPVLAKTKKTNSGTAAPPATSQQKVIQEIIRELPVCDNSDLMIEPAGFQCKTLKGGLFEKRVSTDGSDVTWIDLRSKRAWFISSVGGRSHVDAKAFCERLGYKLPNESEILQGEAVGFRGVFQPDAKARYFWVMTDKVDEENARVFSATSGAFDQIELLHKKNTKTAVICTRVE